MPIDNADSFNIFAIVSIIVGIIFPLIGSILFYTYEQGRLINFWQVDLLIPLSSLLGILFGVIALRQIHRKKQKGRILTIVSLVLSMILFTISTFTVILITRLD